MGQKTSHIPLHTHSRGQRFSLADKLFKTTTLA